MNQLDIGVANKCPQSFMVILVNSIEGSFGSKQPFFLTLMFLFYVKMKRFIFGTNIHKQNNHLGLRM